MISIRLSFRMNSILSREIPFLNLTNSSYGMNRGEWDFPGCSKVDVGVAVWFLASQDAENHRTDAHIMIGASPISRSGKGSKDVIASLPKPGFITLQIVDKAQCMVCQAALLKVTLSSSRAVPLFDAPIWLGWWRWRRRPDRSQSRSGLRQAAIPRGQNRQSRTSFQTEGTEPDIAP